MRRSPRPSPRDTIAAPIEAEPAKPARRPLPAALPRDIVEHAAPCDAAGACVECGGVLRPLGEDVTELLDYVPGSFRVIRHVRPKLSCRSCETITQAPAPSLPIRRGRAGAGLLAHVLVAKYCRPSPAAPASRDLRARGHRPQPLDDGRHGGPERAPAAPARRRAGTARDGRRAGACRRHRRAGARARSGPHADGAALGLCARRSPVRRTRPGGGVLPLHAGPQRRAPAGASERVPRHPAGRRLCRVRQALRRRPHRRGRVPRPRSTQVLGRARGDQIAARARGAGPHRRAVSDRGHHPRQAARSAPRRLASRTRRR